MEVLKGLNIRIYPTQKQRIQINRTIGSTRFLYNQMLAERIDVYNQLHEDKRELYEHKYKSEKDYKNEFPWLKEVSSISLQQSRMDLTTSFSNFFKSLKGKRKGSKVGFPKFKSKRNKGSYREVITNNNIQIDFDERKLKLPKVGKIKYRHKNIKSWYKESSIRNVTITKFPSGKYYATILFKGEAGFSGEKIIDEDSKVIGLDMSLDKFYVDQLGNSPAYKRLFRESEVTLAKYQKRLSRKQKGSNNYERARIKVAKVHEKITNSRRDFIHTLSHNLVKNNDVIVVENLSLKGMSQALNLGKSVMDLGYSEFVRQLQYKSLWNDKILIEADRWFASSKLCSFCGFKKSDLHLSERSWDCPNCNTSHNRDKNAGQNLYNYGKIKLGLGQPSKPVESIIESYLNESTTKQEASESLAQR